LELIPVLPSPVPVAKHLGAVELQKAMNICQVNPANIRVILLFLAVLGRGWGDITIVSAGGSKMLTERFLSSHDAPARNYRACFCGAFFAVSESFTESVAKFSVLPQRLGSV
jgi:hypothetical protein